MIRYKDMALEFLAAFETYEVVQVPCDENLDVDMLSKLSQSTPIYVSQMARVEEVTSASIDVV